MTELTFFVLAAMALGGSIGVVLQKSPVASLLCMVGTLASVAGIFVLLEAHFLAAVQVLVYAGAIMVLFLFVIMLLNLGHDYEPDLKRGFFLFLAFGIVGAFAGLLSRQLRGAEDNPIYQYFPGPEGIDQLLAEQGAVGAVARPLFTQYVVAFELVGLLLLAALVGAVALAKRRV